MTRASGAGEQPVDMGRVQRKFLNPSMERRPALIAWLSVDDIFEEQAAFGWPDGLAAKLTLPDQNKRVMCPRPPPVATINGTLPVTTPSQHGEKSRDYRRAAVRSSKNSDAGSTLVTSRLSRARVQATYSRWRSVS